MTGCSSREENHEKADACKSTYLTGIRFFVYISCVSLTLMDVSP